MAQPSRGKETTIVFTEEGATLAGAWAKVKGWNLKADATINKRRYLGQAEAEGDLDHQGWEFGCTVLESGPQVRQVYDRQVQANNAGLPTPRITITATTAYRDGVTPPRVDVLRRVTLKLDGFRADAGDDAVNEISGFASLAGPLSGTA